MIMLRRNNDDPVLIEGVSMCEGAELYALIGICRNYEASHH